MSTITTLGNNNFHDTVRHKDDDVFESIHIDKNPTNLLLAVEKQVKKARNISRQIFKVYDLEKNPKYQDRKSVRKELDRLDKSLREWQRKEEAGETARYKW